MVIFKSSIPIQKLVSILFLPLCLIHCSVDNPTAVIANSILNYENRISLEFSNMISDDSLNIYDFHYLYNGGGVAVADLDNDGHKDIFLGGNMVSSALLSGDGQLNFENVTEQAGLHTDKWINGISIVDIDNNNYPDIYLSVGGPNCNDSNCKNLLFINYSKPGQFIFQEEAKKYGLDIPLYSQQGLFLDVDKDGDLDLYQLQNYVDPQTKNYPKPKRYYSKKSFDKLFINQQSETGKVHFVDRSEQWGINFPGFGLGVACDDLNEDGYPDIYVSNDFITDDLIYINQDGKGFSEQSKDLLKHTSYNSMGVDLGDINGDELSDILVVDMLPYENSRQKTMLGSMNYDKHLLSKKEGYNSQYVKNTLSLHNGVINNSIIPFSEVSALEGIHQTDWSWSPLIVDLNNDTYPDIYISNGYGKNITDLDFVNFNSKMPQFGDKKSIKKKLHEDITKLPAVNLKNHLFIQTDGGFKKILSPRSTITNGVAYSDLDNDGDLDIIQNNINESADILINNSSLNYIKIDLQQADHNNLAYGAYVTVELDNNKKISKFHNPVRSYLSCMDPEIVIGLGEAMVRNIKVRWPNGNYTSIDTLIKNTKIQLVNNSHILQQDKDSTKILFTTEKIFNKEKRLIEQHDFSIQPLLFKSCLDEKIVIASNGENSELFLANLDNSIYSVNINLERKESILNIGDGIVTDLKYYKVNGQAYLAILYLQQSSEPKSRYKLLSRSQGSWSLQSEDDLPLGIYHFIESSQLILRSPSAKDYPSVTGPALFHLDIDKHKILPAHEIDLSGNCLTSGAGLITDEAEQQIVIVGEWMFPKIVTKNEKGEFEIQDILGDKLKGYWQHIYISDLDNDGDQDLLLGNIGNNSRMKANVNNPLQLTATDLDKNGSLDPLMSLYNEDSNSTFPYGTRDDIAKQLPTIKEYYNDYASFSEAEYHELLKNYNSDADLKEINILESIILENLGNNEFQIRPLPKECQYSSINNSLLIDINNDELDDIIFTTNIEAVEVHNGQLDGLNTLVLRNKGNLNFEVISYEESGLVIPESTGDIIEIQNNKLVIASSQGLYKVEY